MKAIHYSIDDVFDVFRRLTELHPKSIFELPFFAYFQKLHQRYGLVISCYCFFKKGDFSLCDVTRAYKTEFERNSSWIRFGFHGYTGCEDYNLQALDESICQYRKVICNLREIVGENSLDTFPRIHTFRASRDFLHYLADNDILSLKGVLAADDDRISYSLTFSENEELKHQGILIKDNLCFLKTSQRFDGLGLRMQKKLFSHMGGHVILFTHEWLLYHPHNLKNKIKSVFIKQLMTISCKYYSKKGYCFAFPMDYNLNNNK